jgi:hypothetical protein
MSNIKRLTEQANKYGSITVTLDVNEVMTLLKERDALAVECGALKKQAVFIFNAGYSRGHESTVEGNYVHVYQSDIDSFHEEDVAEIMNENTPATEAYLNALRAEGLKMAIDHMNNQTSDNCADVTVLPVIEMYNQLRAGEPS